jgi:hypothetical protein
MAVERVSLRLSGQSEVKAARTESKLGAASDGSKRGRSGRPELGLSLCSNWRRSGSGPRRSASQRIFHHWSELAKKVTRDRICRRADIAHLQRSHRERSSIQGICVK